ncbi:uncharacterized protein LOC142639611 [Castanea sativa]|uniref:uncharacterized protein LOC142639611 n=1 Tax=Castanea sativa TaxID=21020 RepID=UPI003F64B908
MKWLEAIPSGVCQATEGGKESEDGRGGCVAGGGGVDGGGQVVREIWIRLNELPIEYYNAEALYLIGKAIGNVLRVDTHTAAEARGRFARLCIQVDVTKPLVTAIRIGKLEQPMCYEGIQKLCFDCGRMGHKRENCPYSISHDVMSKETAGMEPAKDNTRSCNSCGAYADKGEVGSNEIVPETTQENVEESVHDSTYGLWIVMLRKMGGARNQRTNRGPLGHENVQGQGAFSITNVDGFKELRGIRLSGLSLKPAEIVKTDTKLEQANSVTKPNPQGSVKGKKALARSRATFNVSGSFVGSSTHQVVNKSLLFNSLSNHAFTNGSSEQGTTAKAQSTISEGSNMGNQGSGNSGGEARSSACQNLGAMKPAFKRHIRELVRFHDPAVLLVMETRIGGNRAKEITDDLPFDGAIHTDTIGYAGGLWLLWNEDRVEITQLAKTEQEIHVVVKVRSSNLNWLLIAIYASPRCAERQVLWNNLMKMADLHDMSWVMAGDFNEPLMGGDKFGGRGVSVNRALQFKECLDACSMIDIGFLGPRFTWTNRREIQALIQEMIDRFFVNSQWCLMYLEARVVHLTRCHSDHCPILMELQPRLHENKRKLFKFQSCWLSDCNFPTIVSQAWR